MTIELMQSKRAVLVAQRDQLTANLNATIGAIAVCDELIAETLAEQSKALTAAEPAPEMPVVSRFEPCDDCIAPDRTEQERCCCT